MADRPIRITAGGVAVDARLDESRTATAIWDALPISARANTWGDEIYFDVGIVAAPESPREVVERGTLAYWPPGQAFCIFFGKTPASRGDECRAASGVNVVGLVIGDPTVFRGVRAGTAVRIERKGESKA
jgi:hypothetical protein